MRIYTVAMTLLSLSAAGSAAAAQQVSDVDYLKASRCKGLASSQLGSGLDTSGLDAFLKAQRSGRHAVIQQKADDAQARARREASRDGGARLSAELGGPCKAYLGIAGSGPSQPAS